jgi:hypothetical protein
MAVTVTDDSPVITQAVSPVIVVVDNANTVASDSENYVISVGVNEALVIPAIAVNTVIAGAECLVTLAAGIQGPQGIPGTAGIQGPQGIPGTAGTGSASVLPFSWGDANPALIVTVPAGKKVLKVEALIDTPFDIASGVTVGDTGDHSRLLGVADIDTTTSGTYQTNPGYKYTIATVVNLYISPATGVTAGNGLVLIYLEA